MVKEFNSKHFAKSLNKYVDNFKEQFDFNINIHYELILKSLNDFNQKYDTNFESSVSIDDLKVYFSKEYKKLFSKYVNTTIFEASLSSLFWF